MSVEDAYPLTALQTGMLYHSAYEADAPTYHDLMTMTVRGRFDRPAMAGALEEAAARHPVLRTSFDLTGFSEPLQLVHRDAGIPLEVTDLSGSGPDAARAALEAWRESEKRLPFDWSRPPLLRVHVHRLPDGEFALSLSFHHAILDGWSVAALVTELFRRYAARLAGSPLSAGPPGERFRDQVARERAVTASGEAAAFWRRQIEEAPESRLPRLPGYPTGGPQSVSVLRTTLPAGLPDALAEVARSLRVPLRTVLLAAHLRVLALVTGESAAMSGVVSHGRPESEAGEEVLGLFLNTVPVRVDAAADSWSGLVRRVYDAEVALLRHRRYPLFEIQRMAGRTHLLDVLFDYRDFHVYRGMPGGELEVVGEDFFEQTDFPCAASFNRDPEGGGLDLNLSYDIAQFPRSQMEQIRGHYLTALRHLAADPAADPRPTARYVPAGPIERWNATRKPYDIRSLHELIGEQAGRTPDAPAVGYDGRRLTYRRLRDAAGRITARLRAGGVAPGDVVGVLLDRGPELIPALLGVLGAGAAYLPLEPGLPEERRDYMIAMAGARTVLTDGVTAEAAAFRPEPPVPVPPDSLAYVIFTSGSTGRPKGVAVSHRSIVNRLLWMQETFGLTPSDRVLQKTPIGFDVSVWELFWPLMTGAGVAVARPGGHRDTAYLAEMIAAEQITTLHFVPSMLEMFLEEPMLDGRMDGVRRVICSGEALTPEAAARFSGRLPGAELHNLYGPTEAAVDVTWHPCASGEDRIPIGRPIANTRLEILDGRGERVPVGTPGELCLGGVQLARGYVGRPGLTAGLFVPDPHGPPGARLYRTGDVARWLPGGEVEYLGRADFQVKIRGQRVELGEIETVLAGQPEVASAVVALRDERLVGYVVTAAEDIDWADRLRGRLPDYMIPAAWVRLDGRPLTAAGKLDRSALPEPGRPSGGAAYVPPRDPLEARLATIWEDTLDRTAIGIRDDFFALGGHSLLALRLTMRVRKELGHDLPVGTVLQAPTVAMLAERLRRPHDNATPDRIVPLREGGDRAPIFLVHALGGQVFRYLPLARRLGDDQPVFAITAQGLAPGEEPHTGIDEMIDDYLGHLRKVRPTGPYVLGGLCIGGNIALEMARRLRAEGEQVPLVVLFYSDGAEPVVRETLEDDAYLTMHALAGGPLEIDRAALRRMAPDEQLISVIHAASEADRLQPDAADVDQARRFLRVFRANAHAVGHYRHRPYDGDVALFSPAGEGGPPDPMGWDEIVTGMLRISPIPGERFHVMYEPLVADAATELRNWMDHGLVDD